MSLNRKMLANTIASAGSIGWSALLQLLSVPILISIWGIDRYGHWLMISTIPSYLALSDLGFSTAATSDMSMAFARGKKESVIRTFHSVWLLLVSISIIVVLIASPLLLSFSGHQMSVWWPKDSIAIFWMTAYAVTALCSRLILAGFRSTGYYAKGTIIYDLIQFFEGVAILLAAYLGFSFSVCAFVCFFIRLLNIAICYLYLKNLVPWLRVGFSQADKTEIKRLFKPAMAVMAIPTALVFNIQGMTLVAGVLISPASAVVLNSVRTISRIAIQFMGIIGRSTIPEFSSAVAKKDKVSMQKLFKINLWSVWLILLPSTVAFGVFGSWAINIWTNGHVKPEPTFLWLMASVMLVQGVWTTISNFLLAINKQIYFASILVFSSIFSLAFAFILAMSFGLNGMVCAMLTAEVIAACGVFYGGYKALKEINILS